MNHFELHSFLKYAALYHDFTEAKILVELRILLFRLYELYQNCIKYFNP